MKKTILAISVAAAFSTAADANLPIKAHLSIDQGSKFTTTYVSGKGQTFVTDYTQGSWFSMDADGSGSVAAGEVTVIGGFSGLTADGVTLQNAVGSHGGAPGCTFDGAACSVGYVPAVIDDPATTSIDETAAAIPGVAFTETPDIDNPWLFFSNTGMHRTTAAIGPLTDDGAGNVTLDFSGWNVTWNGIVSIPMGGDAVNYDPALNTGVAIMSCYTSGTYDVAWPFALTTGAPTDCTAGAFYVLDHKAHVPNGDASGFGGVPYVLHLEGIITDTNQAPTAVTDPLGVSVTPGNSVRINAAGNATDPDGDGIDSASVNVTYAGTATIQKCTAATAPHADCLGEGDIIYTDTGGVDTTDSFTYTLTDGLGKIIASPITVNVDVVTGNLPPSCGDNIPVTTNVSTAIDIDVATNANDTDDGVDITTVVTSNPVLGTPGTPTPGGFVNFVPTSTPGTASFDYTVKDNTGTVCGTPGTITIKVNALPVAVDDGPVTVERNSVAGVLINVTANDTDLEDGTVDKTTVATPGGVFTTAKGAFSIDPVTGDITYIPNPGSFGADSFTYTVKDSNNAMSLAATVSIDIVNALPVANNDVASIDTAFNSTVDITVLSNDTDADDGIDASTVIATDGANGVTSVDVSGVVTYTPNVGYVGSDQFTYTVKDLTGDTSNPPATVVVSVSNSAGGVMDPAEILPFTPATINGGVEPASGSWFSMEVSPGTLTYVALNSKDGLILGTTQPASTVGGVTPGIGNPWEFFGSQGVHQTTKAVTILTDDANGNVTLDMSGWNVSWNGIASIPMNSRAHSGGVDGVGVVTCAVDCATGDTYQLDYYATVPSGDPSGFGNVKYHLHLAGTLGIASVGGPVVLPASVATIDAVDASGAAITLQPGDTAVSVGNTSGVHLSNDDIGLKDPLLNTEDGQQCIGGCIDFIATGVAVGSYVDLSFYLTEAIPDGAVYRKLLHGVWQSFDEGAGDQVGSDVATGGTCQPAKGKFNKGLTAGHQCIWLRIYDGGPNDADGLANGTIVDPSGVLVAGSSNSPEGTTNGCSISKTPVKITDRADWLIVVGFITLIGLVSFKRRRQNS